MIILLLSCVLGVLPVDDELVGQVGDRPVSRAEFGDWMVERMGTAWIDEFLRERMLLQAGADRDALPSEEAVEAAWLEERRVIVQNLHHGSLDEWRASLIERDIDPAAFARRRRASMRVELVLEELTRRDLEFTEEQLRKRYRDVYGALGERLSLRVLKFDLWKGVDVESEERPDTEALRGEALARAQEAEQAWRDGTPFAELLARSDDPASDFVEQGVIDVYRKGLLGLEVESAVSQLDTVGEISPPVRVWDGYVLVQLADREEATFEQAREEMRAMLEAAPLTAEQLGTTEERLREEYPVEILLR